MTNLALNTIDSFFLTAEKVEEFDYVAFGQKVVDFFIVAAAILVGVFTYLSTAAQLFWEEHGEAILITTTRSFFVTLDFFGDLLEAARDFHRFANRYTALAADSAYRILADF